MSGGGKLSGEDRALWNRVLQSVKPIHPPKRKAVGEAADASEAVAQPKAKRTGSSGQPPEKKPEKRLEKKPAKRAAAAPYRPPVSAPKAGPAPGLAPLEPRQKRRLARGQAQVEARLDLHGMRQSTAFHTLIGFLRQAQARGTGTVLVITGKGSAGGSANRHDTHGHERGDERGVLRRIVPQWLSRGEFRDLVIGFEPASRRHGGEGALYVRIRRRRHSSA
jgi:DNA-nicking Smr family endonuclease